jgi:hypothetical protein
MTDRIGGGSFSTLNPFGPQWPTAKEAAEARTIGERMQQALFGAPKPPVLDPAKFPMLAAQLLLLNKYKKKLATMAGDQDEDYEIVLADGTIASVDQDGRIYMGAEFLMKFKDQPGVFVGAMAHEIGHRPKRWRAYQPPPDMTQADIEALCRDEETRADLFAGKALAEMGMDCEPLIEFLEHVDKKPHPEYWPAKVRGEIIRDAHQGRAYRADARKKLFPEFDRMTAPKNHLGEG